MRTAPSFLSFALTFQLVLIFFASPQEPAAGVGSGSTVQPHYNLVTLGSPAQDCGDDVRAATTVYDTHNYDRFFFRSISDQKVTHEVEPERAGRKFRANASSVGKTNEDIDGLIDFFSHSIRGVERIGGDELPDFVEIGEGTWVE
jgi:hypothetical protein